MLQQPTLKRWLKTRPNKSRLVHFFQLLQLAISILLTVPASSWPYRGTVGDRESTVLVGPVYGLSPVSLLPAKPELLGTVIRGPATGTTFVEGSSSGPVTIVSPGTPANALRTTPSPAQSNSPSTIKDSRIRFRGSLEGGRKFHGRIHRRIQR